MDDNTNYLTISEAAYALRVSPEALKRWERSGALAIHRDPITNCRLYSGADIEKLRKRMSES